MIDENQREMNIKNLFIHIIRPMLIRGLIYVSNYVLFLCLLIMHCGGVLFGGLGHLVGECFFYVGSATVGV